jgi:hypothetical protein
MTLMNLIGYILDYGIEPDTAAVLSVVEGKSTDKLEEHRPQVLSEMYAIALQDAK